MPSSHSHLVNLYIFLSKKKKKTLIFIGLCWVMIHSKPSKIYLIHWSSYWERKRKMECNCELDIIDKEALCLLEKLNIEHCQQLKKLPYGVKHPRNNRGFPDPISVNCLLGLGLGELLGAVNNIDLCILYWIQKTIDVCFGGQENQRKKNI